jgi:hypothetical protein
LNLDTDILFQAWGDLDVVLGKWVPAVSFIFHVSDAIPSLPSFERIFPWDVADQFDVLLAGWPTNWDNILLYMPGHLTVFRNSPDVAAQFLDTPGLATYNAFIGDDFFSEAPGASASPHNFIFHTLADGTRRGGRIFAPPLHAYLAHLPPLRRHGRRHAPPLDP